MSEPNDKFHFTPREEEQPPARPRSYGRPDVPFTAPPAQQTPSRAPRQADRSAYTLPQRSSGLYGQASGGYGASGQNRGAGTVPYDYSKPSGGYRQRATFTEIPYGDAARAAAQQSAQAQQLQQSAQTQQPVQPQQSVPQQSVQQPNYGYQPQAPRHAAPAQQVPRHAAPPQQTPPPGYGYPSYPQQGAYPNYPQQPPRGYGQAAPRAPRGYRGAGSYSPDNERARAIAAQYQAASQAKRASSSRRGTPPPRNGAPSAPRQKKRGFSAPPPVFWIALLIVAALIFAAVKIFSGAAGRKNTTHPQPVPTQPPVTVTAAPQQGQEGENAPEVTPEPTATPEPTPEPTGPKAKINEAGLCVPADWGVAIPKRATACYDSFFDKSCIIGNSLVEGFFMWSGLTNARYIYDTGATVNNVLGKMDLGPIALNEGYYTNVYLMFGLNEVGGDVNSFIDSYRQVVAYIRDYQPTANIILISVTPVTKEVHQDPNEAQNMERINTFNAALKDLCEKDGLWYLDIYSLLLDGEGFLSADYAYAGDGKHFEKSGYVAWANYMREHYVDAALATE